MVVFILTFCQNITELLFIDVTNSTKKMDHAKENTDWYEWMSMTKAVIGTLFFIHTTKQQRKQTFLAQNISLEDILLGTTGRSNDETFDYDKFRNVVESNQDINKYAMKRFKVQETPADGFTYNNISWQLAASVFEGLCGITLTDAFEKLVGNTNEWHWETDVNGQELAPHGIKGSKIAAMHFGNVCFSVLPRMQRKMTHTGKGWWTPAIGFAYGWWFVNKDYAFARGYQAQNIVVNWKKKTTRVQLRKEFWTEPNDQERRFVLLEAWAGTIIE